MLLGELPRLVNFQPLRTALQAGLKAETGSFRPSQPGAPDPVLMRGLGPQEENQMNDHAIKNAAREAFLAAIDQQIATRKDSGLLSGHAADVWVNQRNRIAVFLGESKHRYNLKRL